MGVCVYVSGSVEGNQDSRASCVMWHKRRKDVEGKWGGREGGEGPTKL